MPIYGFINFFFAMISVNVAHFAQDTWTVLVGYKEFLIVILMLFLNMSIDFCVYEVRSNSL